jgi:hypothetical protein
MANFGVPALIDDVSMMNKMAACKAAYVFGGTVAPGKDTPESPAWPPSCSGTDGTNVGAPSKLQDFLISDHPQSVEARFGLGRDCGGTEHAVPPEFRRLRSLSGHKQTSASENGEQKIDLCFVGKSPEGDRPLTAKSRHARTGRIELS